MKKLITIITLTLASALAFAITDAQKAEFINLVKSDVKGGAEFASTVEKASQTEVAKAVATWAEAEPQEFYEWLNSDTVRKERLGSGGIWTIRKALNMKKYPPYSLQDCYIHDYWTMYDEACASESVYQAIKTQNFTAPNCSVKMSDGKIWGLIRSHNDIALMMTFPEKSQAEHIVDVLKIVRGAKLSAKKTYETYCTLARNLAEFKESVKVLKENWETLQNDKNEAFMAYYAEAKLEALNK